jgi:[histone H3]-lysine36 N-trimethyltransferase
LNSDVDQSISDCSEISISDIDQSQPSTTLEPLISLDESISESKENTLSESGPCTDTFNETNAEMCEKTVAMDTEISETSEDQSETIKKEIKVESEMTKEVVKLEEKLSSVVLEEGSQQVESANLCIADVEMLEVKPEPIEPEVNSSPIEPVNETVSENLQDNVNEKIVENPIIENEAKQDDISSLHDILYDFPEDNEGDGNFVRRSRRLQSTYIEQLTKTEAKVEDEIVTTKIDTVKPEKIKEEVIQEKPLEPQFRSKESEARLKKYETIRDNIILKKSEKKNKKEGNKTMKCDCTISEKNIRNGEMGCQFNCINRLLYIECSTKCRCGDYCDNQQFQRYNYSPCSVFETANKGFGIRADEDIPAETFLIEYVGEVLDNKQFEKRAKKYSENKNEHFYFMALKTNAIIDATKKGNISRFINHSCDPNAETQKWTVNGELRVGFFSIRDIKRGEEIVFDYQYQRYGKEAQKCYCEAPNCRGWIGENPLDDEEDEENDEIVEEVKKTKGKKGRKPKTQSEVPEEIDQEDTKKDDAPKKVRKKRTPTEDLDVAAKINELEKSGLKNNHQTIEFARLMNRVKTIEARSRMITILITGAEPCLRLFMDYRGLTFLYNWMSEINVKSSIPDLEIALELMKALTLLPISNKTILKNSKILDRMEKWKNLDLEENKLTKEERKLLKAEKKKNKLHESTEETVKTETAEETLKALEAIDEESLDDLAKLKIKVKKFASELLLKWEALKEDFKIPRKAKQDIMYQHQLQADENNWDENTASNQRVNQTPNERYKNRYRNESNQIHANRTFSAPFKKQTDNNQLSKHQRRQAFELEIEQKNLEKRMTAVHEKNCNIFGLNPYATTPLDVPVRVNRVTGEYITIDGRVVPPPPNHNEFKYEPMTLSTNPDDYHLPPMDLPEHWRFAIDERGRIYYYHTKIRQSQWEVPVKILPLTIDESDEESPESDESTTETEDSEEEELKQLLEFLKRKKLLSTTAHLSNTSSLSAQQPLTGDDEEDLEKKIMSNMIKNPVDQPIKITQIPEKRKKTKRHGLTSMQFIKPRSEADKIAARIDNKKYKEVKEKLRQKKRRILKGEIKPGDESSDDDEDIELNDIDKTKFVDEIDILEKNNKKKIELEKKIKKPKTPVMDLVEMKRQFRDEIKIEVVKYLQPYKEETCEKGKILTDEDFDSLASKVKLKKY